MIRTQRLELAPVLASDARAALSGESNVGWAPDYPTEGDLVIARLVLDNSTIGDGGVYVPYKVTLRETGLVIGGCGFLGPPDEGGSVEIGYGLAPSQRGNGFATEAVSGLVERAWTDPRVRVVAALTDPDNERSQSVLRRAGFEQVGSLGEQTRWEIRRTTDRSEDPA